MKNKTNKIIAFTALALFVASPSFAVDSHVKGHTKKNGSYVAPHKSKPNHHNTKGKKHSPTGKKGIVEPHKQK